MSVFQRSSGLAKVVLLNIPRQHFNDVIRKVREECDLKTDHTTEVAAAGWQSHAEEEKLEKALNVR